MALTIVANNMNPAAGSAAGGGGVTVNAGSLRLTRTTVTVGASGDYSAGGVPLTAAQLSLNGVIGGWVNTVTSAASNTVTGATLQAQTDGSAKLKLNAIAAEAVGAGVVAAVYDVYALGW